LRPWARLSCTRCEGPRGLTQNSQESSVTRLRSYESAINRCLVFLRKISSPATFDFCNTIPAKADIGQTGRHVCFVPFSTHAPQQGKPHYAKSPGRLGRLEGTPSLGVARFE